MLYILFVIAFWNYFVAYDDQSKDTAAGPYLVPPPAIIHKGYSHNVPPNRETKFKGSGFWRGW